MYIPGHFVRLSQSKVGRKEMEDSILYLTTFRDILEEVELEDEDIFESV